MSAYVNRYEFAQLRKVNYLLAEGKMDQAKECFTDLLSSRTNEFRLQAVLARAEQMTPIRVKDSKMSLDRKALEELQSQYRQVVKADKAESKKTPKTRKTAKSAPVESVDSRIAELEAEIAALKKENTNLKRSNTQLKNAAKKPKKQAKKKTTKSKKTTVKVAPKSLVPKVDTQEWEEQIDPVIDVSTESWESLSEQDKEDRLAHLAF